MIATRGQAAGDLHIPTLDVRLLSSRHRKWTTEKATATVYGNLIRDFEVIGPLTTQLLATPKMRETMSPANFFLLHSVLQMESFQCELHKKHKHTMALSLSDHKFEASLPFTA